MMSYSIWQLQDGKMRRTIKKYSVTYGVGKMAGEAVILLCSL
jgi:hypothetical protein